MKATITSIEETQGIYTVNLEWIGPDDHTVEDFDLDQLGPRCSGIGGATGGTLRSGWVVLEGQCPLKVGDTIPLLPQIDFHRVMSSCGIIYRATASIASQDYRLDLDLAKTWMNIIDQDIRCESCAIDEDGDVISVSGECVSQEWTDSDWQTLTTAAAAAN
jgi:hypothetical protein